jgi:hypothetical protein
VCEEGSGWRTNSLYLMFSSKLSFVPSFLLDWSISAHAHTCMAPYKKQTLRENSNFSCVKIFVVRFLSGACRAFCTGRTAKKRRTVKNSLPCVFSIAHDKLFFFQRSLTPLAPRGKWFFLFPLQCVSKKRMTKRCLCCAFLLWRAENYIHVI